MMSETQSTSSQADNDLACEAKKLIVEVMGTEHPDDYTFRIFDETNAQQQEWLESQADVESLDEQALHVWPWEGSQKKNIWLDIAADNGSPIRVPLFCNLDETPRQMGQQFNRIWPLVPLTLMSDASSSAPTTHPVTIRPGFITIFREGVLWRELEVVNIDAGTLAFHDVRLTDFRSSPGSALSDDRRPPVGSALESIWLPVREMAGNIFAEFELAYSEVQLSAERIAFLESHTGDRSEHCVKPANPNRTLFPDAPGQWASLTDLPEMRLRESYVEQHLPQPWKNVYDLSGTHAKNLFDQAVEEQQAFSANRESAESAFEAANYRDAPLRGASSIRAAALESRQSDGGDSESEMWTSQGKVSDALALVRKRGWGALVVKDPLFDIRHYLAQANDAQRYLTALIEKVAHEPHTDSAQLVYRVMGPEYLGGKKNPLNEHLEEIDSGMFGRLHRTLHTAQRKLAIEDLALGQKHVLQVVKSAASQRALADLFTLKGADYIEGFAVAQSLIQALAINPGTADALRVEKPNVVVTHTKQCHTLLIDILTDGSDEPLHSMLFPADDGDGNAKSPADDVSRGDGRCRPDDIESLAKKVPDAESLQTMAAVALAGIAKSESMNLSTELKRWVSVVNSVFDGIQKTYQAAATRIISDAEKLNARLYGPLLRLAKARDPELLGAVKLVTRSKVPADWVIIGVNDPAVNRSFGLTPDERKQYVNSGNGHKRFYGEFYKPGESTPLASTNRTKMPDLGDTPEARNMHVYAAPASSEVTKAHREVRRYARWDQLAENVRLPYFIVVIEAFNIGNELKIFRKVRASRGQARAVFGFASAGTDLIIASAIATEKLLLDVAKWDGAKKVLDKTLFKINKELVARFSPRLAKVLPRLVSRRLFGGLVSGGLTIILSITDMAYEIDTGDTDTAVAHGVAAVGGAMMIMGGLMGSTALASGATVILLGLGPVAWVGIGLALAIGAGIAAIFLNDPPLVDWLKRGPFGTEQDDMYDHIGSSPSEAYHRLTGILSRPRIIIERVNNFSVGLTQNNVALDVSEERRLSRVNCMVRIENNIASFLDESSLNGHLRLVDETTTIINKPNTHGFPEIRRTVRDDEPEVLLEQPLANGKAFYIHLPPSENSRSLFRTVLKGKGVAVRAQWKASWDGKKDLYFPAPELEDPTSFMAADHGKPDFDQVNQPFWADEQTHRVEE